MIQHDARNAAIDEAVAKLQGYLCSGCTHGTRCIWFGSQYPSVCAGWKGAINVVRSMKFSIPQG